MNVVYAKISIQLERIATDYVNYVSLLGVQNSMYAFFVYLSSNSF
jgi:hypothetical protein